MLRRQIRLLVRRAEWLRLVLARQHMCPVPRVLDDVQRVRFVVPQLRLLPEVVLPTLPRARTLREGGALPARQDRLHVRILYLARDGAPTSAAHPPRAHRVGRAPIRPRTSPRTQVLASAAGIGGGAVLVPLFTLLGEFTEHEAIPLSLPTRLPLLGHPAPLPGRRRRSHSHWRPSSAHRASRHSPHTSG